jgi:hypothetical protein
MGAILLHEVSSVQGINPSSPRLTRAQGSVTLGPEQGELEADFSPLGHLALRPWSISGSSC